MIKNSPSSPNEDQEMRVKVFSYRNTYGWSENIFLLLGIALWVYVLIRLTSGESLLPTQSSPQNQSTDLLLGLGFLLCVFVGICIQIYKSLPFWFERIVIDQDRLTWTDRWGRVRRDTHLSRVRVVDDALSFHIRAKVVHTDDGDIHFRYFINQYDDLIELLRESKADDNTMDRAVEPWH